MIAGIVLAGGGGRRLGGADKAAIKVGGRTMLDRVLDGFRSACDVVVIVGPPRPIAAPAARFVMEDPPGGGPVPAVATALTSLGDLDDDDVVVVSAVDLPFVADHDVRRLIEEVRSGAPAAAAAGPKGPNPLLAAYRVGALRSAIERMDGALAGSRAERLLPVDVVDVELGERATFNVNRPEDVTRAERLASDF